MPFPLVPGKGVNTLESPSFLTVLFNLLVVFLLVLLNGFFVAAEFAIVKVRQSRLLQLANEGNRKARYAQHVTNHLDAYLSACQLGITLASLGLGWVGEPAIARMIEPVLEPLGVPSMAVHSISFVIAFSFITFLHIVLGELAPKSIAIRKAEPATLWLSPPLMLFYKVMYPAIWFLNGTANAFLRRIGIEPVDELQQAHTEEEIRILVKQSHQRGLIDQTERVLVDNVFEFSERLAREVMVPRTKMVVLYLEDSFEENLSIARETRHTRYPVAEEDKDNIIGFVHVSDLYAEALKPGSEKSLKPLIRPILTVPESMELSQVLRLMQKKRVHMAIVVDEYGGTAGLLTLEDILEEIVGDIQDEFDNERPLWEKKGDVYSVDGRVLIETVNELLSLDIENEEVDSIGGWVYTRLEGAPEVGKTVVYDNVLFEVAEMDRLRISRLNIRRLPEATDSNAADAAVKAPVEQR
ncbi:hemolysin family protein [Calditerricola yamamurae]